jgi:type II secretory pathway component GspD/PulD (secretin)
VKVFQLKYSKAKEIEEQLKTQLDSKKVGMVKADERSNQVIIQTLPDRMADIERLITALDKKTKVVLIDTQIVKIKLSDSLNSGVNWEGIFNMKLPEKVGMAYAGSYPFSVLQESTEGWMFRNDFLKSLSGQVGAIPFSGNTSSVNASTKSASGQNMHVGIVKDDMDFDVLVNFLQTLGKTQVLSSPKLSVINNQEAKIHVGERQAYVTTTTTSGQTTTTVSEEVTFVDVGIQLSVTPTINDEGDVTMKIKPEVSTVVSTLITPSGNKIPILDTSMAETTVMVKDNSTIIIGGLRKEEKISSSNGLSILGRIPFLGNLFKSETSSKERTELLVLITPHIVKGDTLFTGDEREFGIKPVKEFKEYPALTSESDYQAPRAAPEEIIKPYVEYKGLHEIDKPGPTIKGVEDNE